MPHMFTQCGALSFLGAILVSLQLVVVYQLSKHATLVDQTGTDCRRIEKPIVRNSVKQEIAPIEKSVHPRHYSPTGGTFNGIPLTFREKPMEYSTVACVGDNYQLDSYLYRSCQFRHFCFDIETRNYVVSTSPQESLWLQEHVYTNNSLVGSAVNTNTSLSLGGVNAKWGKQDFRKLEWFPRILDKPIVGYYSLPDDYVWVPYHSMAGFNAGHLVWDDFLPIHTLLTMFGFVDGDDSLNLTPLLTRFVLKTTDPLWATCDFNADFEKRCKSIIRKFLALMGIESSTFSTTNDFSFETKSTPPLSKYVCSKYAAAGIGMLTDHGTKAHGWDPVRDHETTHNAGRGASLYKFRNWMMHNLKISTAPLSPERPFDVTFSISSSQSGARNLNFRQQIVAVESAFSRNETQVHAHVMKSLSLEQQVSLASKTAVYITSSGGGAVTATFLPRGATLIIYYQGDGSRVKNVRTYLPARLDWDLFNHMSYLKVHWIPVKEMNTPRGLELLTSLIRNELDGIARSA